MPLAIHPWHLLLFSFSCVALAGPEALPFLSPYVSSIIPTCAQHCFEEFIVESFPTSACPNQQDLSCLCTSKSRTGFTLGEGALECLAQNCSGESESQLALAYEICFVVPNAASETHRIITATVYPSTRTTCSQSTITTSTKYFISTIPSIETIQASTSSSSMSLPTSIITASGTPFSMNPTSWQPSIQTSTTLGTQTRSPSSTVTASAATSSVVAAAAASGLSNAQISGIVVGSLVAGALALGLLFFFTRYSMRRRRLRDSGSSFGGGEVVEVRPTVPYHSDPVADLKRRGPPADRAPAKAQRILGFPNRYNENRWSLWRRTPPSPISNSSLQLGFPKPPNAFAGSHEHSPTSAVSYQTTSRLLPDMPTYDMPSSLPRSYPARARNPVSGESEQSEDLYDATVPRPSPLRPHRNSQRLRPSYQGPSDFRFPPQPQTLADPFVDDPRARMYALERKRAAKEALPRIITPAIHASDNNSWSPSRNPTIHPPPIFNHNRPAQAPKQAHFNPQPVSRAISPSLYSSRPSYASSDPRISNFSHPNRDSQYPPREPSYQPYQPTQNFAPRSASHSRKSAGRRPLTHLTTASDTSFEESDVEDSHDAPLPDSALSPVVESPLNVRAPPAQANRSLDASLSSRSPIADIRYPPIPGTAVSSYSRRQLKPSPPNSPTPKPQQQRRPNPRLPLTIKTTGIAPQANVRPGDPGDKPIGPKPTIRLVPPQSQRRSRDPPNQAAPAELDGTSDSLPHGAVRRPEHIINDALPQIRPGGGTSGSEALRRTAKHRVLLNQDIQPPR